MFKNILISLVILLASTPADAAQDTVVKSQTNTNYSASFDISTINAIAIKSTPQPDFDRDVLVPLRAAQKAEAEKKAATEAAAVKTHVLPPKPKPLPRLKHRLFS
jgi:hypothetical protein